MSPQVQIRDGIEIHLDSGERVVADADAPDGDMNILSHAHGDHLYSEAPERILCSDLTAALAAQRRTDCPTPKRVSSPRVDLLESGHIPGSRAALIKDEGARILYTGDISTRDRFYLSGFEPVDADILIIESTYGTSDYELPPQDEEEAAFVSCLNETMGTPILAFGYTLGRAQELQLLGARSDRETIYVTDAIERINEVIESHFETTFDVESYTRDTILGPKDMVVLPSQTNQLSFVDGIIEETGAIKVGVSGWAVESSFKYRGDFDHTFALSDHCGFTELIDVVEAVDPETVYTNHGFTDELATEITSRLGIHAQSLKRNQSTLGDF